MPKLAVLLVGVIALLALASTTAMADAIDGNWCSKDGRSLAIKGPSIVTPGGAKIAGDYDRHGFAYIVPATEDGAGTQIVMRLLDEQTMRLSMGGSAEVWRRCNVVS